MLVMQIWLAAPGCNPGSGLRNESSNLSANTMATPTKRYCKKCEREWPIEDFLRDGELPKGKDRYVCTRKVHRLPKGTISAKKKARQIKKERKLQSKDAYPANTHWIREKRRRQSTTKLTPLHDVMTRAQYAAYLESIHWKNFTAAYRSDPGTSHACYVCGEDGYQLHHHTYARLGKERYEDVVPLCSTHHKAVHRAVKSGVKLAHARSEEHTS